MNSKWLPGRLRKPLAQVFGGHAAKRQKRAIVLIEQSSLFDRNWYRTTYPDVAESGIDPLRHYLQDGWREGRDPGPDFSTTAYLKAHADVAAEQINPLLHYVEYGHSEGRGAPDHRTPMAPKRSPRPAFGASAPCANFAIDLDRAVSWRRAAEFDDGIPHLHRLRSALVVGYSADAASAEVYRCAIDRMAALAGAGTSRTVPTKDAHEFENVIDAWMVCGNRFRSRWRPRDDGSPMVVRILQQVDGPVEMVGEGLVTSELDCVDAKTINPFFPLLFVFVDVDGLILATRMVAFPSLCRGGLHHPEFVAGRTVGPVDEFAVGWALAEQMLAIRTARSEPLVARIEVDLIGANGTHPLFQPHFKQWLSKVAHVEVQAGDDGGAIASRGYLADSVQVVVDGAPRRRGAKLILGSDMVPSISALAAWAGKRVGDRGNFAVPVVISGENASHPSVLIRPPSDQAIEHPPGFAPVFPTLDADDGVVAGQVIPAFAVRSPPPHPMAVAEWLIPVSPPALRVARSTTPITWMLRPDGWDDQDLMQSLESLGAQSDAGPLSILFIGPASPAATDLARSLFRGRVQISELPQSVNALARTPLVGFLGQSVVLHDRRSAAWLAQLLDEPRNVSASIPIVAVDPRGKGYVVSPAATGLATRAGTPPMSSPQLAVALGMLWRSSWPSSAPPEDLWLARTNQLARLTSSTDASDASQAHICSSLLSASYIGPRSLEAAAISLNPVAPDYGVEIELVA